MIALEIKVDAKQQEIKKLLVLSYNFSQESLPSKLEMQCKTGICIRINREWFSIQLEIVREEQGCEGRVYLTDKS